MSGLLADAYARGRRKIDALNEAQADLERARFLEQLDQAEFEVTDWEARFIESFFKQVVPPSGDGFRNIRFTPKQREVVEKMRKRYGYRVKSGAISSRRETTTHDHESAIRRTGASTDAAGNLSEEGR